MVRTWVSRGPLSPLALSQLTFSEITAKFSQKRIKMTGASQLSSRVTFTAHIVSRTGIFDLQVDARKNSSFLIKSTVRATCTGVGSA